MTAVFRRGIAGISLLFLSAPSLPAQQEMERPAARQRADEMTRTIRALIRTDGQGKARRGSARQTDMALSSTLAVVLGQRIKSIESLIRSNPRDAAQLLFEPSERDRILAAGGGALIESAHTVRTRATPWLVEDEGGGEPRMEYRLEPGGPVDRAYASVSAVPVGCGGEVVLSGHKAGRTLLATRIEPVPAAAGDGGCSPEGEQRTAVVLLRREEEPWPIPEAGDYYQFFFGPGEETVRAQVERFSHGKATLTGDVFGYYTVKPVSTDCGAMNQALQETLAYVASSAGLDGYRRVIGIVPRMPNCLVTASSTLGCAGFGVSGSSTLIMTHPNSITTGTMSLVLKHLGYNFGIMQARSREFPDGPLGADESRGSLDTTGDPYSVMGSSWRQPPAAPHKAMLGWLKPHSDYLIVDEPMETMLAPADGSRAGVIALKVKRRAGPEEWLWIEHYAGPGQGSSGEAAYHGGLLIHRETPRTGLFSELLNFGLSMKDAELRPGSIWRDPFGPLTIEAGEQTEAGIAVRIRYEAPCAKPAWPALDELPAGAYPFFVPVEAGPECDWQSRANNEWLSLITPESAAGAATARFDAEANPDPGGRNGSVTIGRQTRFFAQKPNLDGTAVELFSPRSARIEVGSTLRFSAGVSRPMGLNSVRSLDVWAGQSPVDRAGCGFRAASNFDGLKVLPGGDDGDLWFTWLGLDAEIASNLCAITAVTRASPRDDYFQIDFDLTQRQPSASALRVYTRLTLEDGTKTNWEQMGELDASGGCLFGLTPAGVAVGRGGGIVDVVLSTKPGCGWRLSGLPAWVKASPASGSGPALVTLAIEPNPGAKPRTAEATAGDYRLSILQHGDFLGQWDPPEFNQSEVTLPPEPGQRLVEMARDLRGSRVEVTSDAAWLRASNGPSDTPAHSIRLEWDGWNGTSRRSASVYVNGRRLTVVQEAQTKGYMASVAAGTGLSRSAVRGAELPLRSPMAIAVDARGTIYAGERDTGRILAANPGEGLRLWAGSHIAGNWTFHTWHSTTQPNGAGLFGGIQSLAAAPDGSIYALTSPNARTMRFSPDGKVQLILGLMSIMTPGGLVRSEIEFPLAIATDGDGLLYVSDGYRCRIWRVRPLEGETLVAGTGICGAGTNADDATKADIGAAAGMLIDGEGNLYFTEPAQHRIQVISRDGKLRMFAGTGSSGEPRDGALALSSPLDQPTGLAMGRDGSLYFTEPRLGLVRRVTPAGFVVTAGGENTAARFPEITAIAAGPGGEIYVADAALQTIHRIDQDVFDRVHGFDSSSALGDSGPAVNAMLARPSAVISDGEGGLYVADTMNNKVRRIRAGGEINTVAGNGARGTSGDGGPAVWATLNQPEGLALDRRGNLYIADTGNHRIRRVTPEGTLELVAGTSKGFSGDGGSALDAQFAYPRTVAADSLGNIYVADRGNSRVRRIDAGGVVQTVAGDGTVKPGGDGLPAVQVSLYGVNDVAIDSQDRLWIAEGGFRLMRVEPDGILREMRFNSLEFTGIAFAGDGKIWATEARRHGLYLIDPEKGSAEWIAGAAAAGEGTPGWAVPFAMNKPRGVAALPGGGVVVSDQGNDRLIRFVPAVMEKAPTPPAPVLSGQITDPWGRPAQLSPGARLALEGSNLAFKSEAWGAGERYLPGVLGGASVRVGGTVSAMVSSAEGRVEFVVPGGVPPGTADVELGHSGGVSTIRVASQDAWPSLESVEVNGEWFIKGRSTADGDRLGPAGVKGCPCRPARPGELIEVQATGLGAPPALTGDRFLARQWQRVAKEPAVLVNSTNVRLELAEYRDAGLAVLRFEIPRSFSRGVYDVVIIAGSRALYYKIAVD